MVHLVMATAAELLDVARALPNEERWSLVRELLALDPDPPEPQVAREAYSGWVSELARRAREVEQGTVEAEDWEDVRDRLLSEFDDA